MKIFRLLVLCLFSLALFACAEPSTGPVPEDPSSPGQIASERLAARQELSAAQTRDALTLRLAVAATANSQATDRARSAAATATEAAFSLALRKGEASATADAVRLHATEAAGVAQSTTETRNLIATAQALDYRATEAAQGIAQALEAHAATATASAIDHARAQADQDAQQARQVSAVLSWIAPAGVLLTILAMIGLLYRLASQWIDARHEQWRLENQRVALMSLLVETRIGTIAFLGDAREGYTPRLMAPPATDSFDASQLPVAQPLETFRFNTSEGPKDIAKIAPIDDRTEANRKLAMRLLRDAIRHAGAEANKLPGSRDLGWPAETWTRAVKGLKPHVTTKPGRGGGTFLAPEWANLRQLYAAVGERRVSPLPAT